MENTKTKFVPVEPKLWKPEKEGDLIEGVLISKKTDIGANKSNAYYIENKEGTFFVWGSAVLDDRLSVVPVGVLIRIEYKGLKPSTTGGNDTKIFKVEREAQEGASEPKIEEETVVGE